VQRYNKVVSKILGTKGREPMNLDPAPELQPVIDITQRPEFWSLADEAPAQGWADMAASPGNNNAAEVVNPQGSGIIMTFYRVVVKGVAGSIFAYITGLGGVGFTPQTTQGWADARMKGQPMGVVYTRATTIPGNRIGLLGVANGAALVVPVEIVIPPGFEFGIVDNNVNEALTCGFYWREKAAETGELSRV
jgi:hypothetical protein